MKKKILGFVAILGFAIMISVNSCTPASNCTDGVQNGTETGVDCGGSDCPACVVTPTCTDGVQNGTETGIDCGGTCTACVTTPTCTDGVQNGTETGVDCGGSCQACGTAPTCTDGIMNGDETGVDCGGTTCNACVTCSDGIQNGTETAIDCGGTCPPCVTKKFKFDKDGVSWTATNSANFGFFVTEYDDSQRSLWGYKSLSSTSSSYEKMHLNLGQVPTVGATYAFVNGFIAPAGLFVTCSYSPSNSSTYPLFYANSSINSLGTLTITEYNTAQEYIKGTFSMTIYNQQFGSTDSLVITNGDFALPFD